MERVFGSKIKGCRVWYPRWKKTGVRKLLTESNDIQVIFEEGTTGKGKTR